MKTHTLRILSSAIFLTMLIADLGFAGLKINEQAPTFSLRDSEGDDFFLSDFVGITSKTNSKGVIVNFFATWCEPCKRELPLINSRVDDMNNKNVQVVIIGVKEDFSSILPLLTELKIDRPIILSDRYGKVSEKYHIRSLPVTFFIGSQGRIKDIIWGEVSDVKSFNKSVFKMLK